MLTLTENACTIVKQMTDAPDVPDTAGLRISQSEAGYAVTATDQAQPGDLTVEQDGATVYLDEGTATNLDAMTLDAGVDNAGKLQFGLLAQA